MNPNKKDDNLAYASLELIDIPQLPPTILDVKQIPCRFDLTPESLKEFAPVDKEFDPNVQQVTGVEKSYSTIDDLVEFVYAGRQMAAMNCIQLAC